MSSRRARIPVSINLLEYILPAGSVIHSFTQNEFYRIVDVIVEHPSFDELKDGDPIPTKALIAYRCPNYIEHTVKYVS